MSSRAKKKIRRPVRVDADLQDARRMLRHGITPQDLSDAGKRGFEQGAQASREYMIKLAYAAGAMAFKDMCKGNGTPCDRETVRAFLVRMDDYICNALTADEAIDDAWRQVGLHLEFSGAFPEDRVVENEP